MTLPFKRDTFQFVTSVFEKGGVQSYRHGLNILLVKDIIWNFLRERILNITLSQGVEYRCCHITFF